MSPKPAADAAVTPPAAKQRREQLHLTDSLVRKLPVPAKGAVLYRDDGARGLGCRVTANGIRSFVLRYVTRNGRERLHTIGQFGAGGWTVQAARQEARRLRALIDQGIDPAQEIADERAAPTMRDLVERFEAEHLPRRRPGTAYAYTRTLRLHVEPHFGKHRKVAEVSFEDVDALHRSVTSKAGPYAGNRTLAVLSKMFSLAVRWRMRSDNPVKGVERNTEAKRKRYLSGDELVRLTEALRQHHDQQVANIFRLLLLTGARKGEVLGMQWADVDLEKGVWSKPGSTTKQKTEHVVPLSAPARQLLAEMQTLANPKKPLGKYVFSETRSGTGHIVELKNGWRHITKSANITALRIHDLRHTFASQLVSSGASLPLIGALLGHSNPTTTARYAHLFDDPQRQAVERIGEMLDNVGKPAAPVVPLRQPRGRS
jgi:integrase